MGRAERSRDELALFVVALALLGGLGAWGRQVSGTSGSPAIGQEENRPRAVTVTARRYAFAPDRIEVEEGDLVKITLRAEDIPHSFALDAYRIVKRAEPGHPVTFEFRADQSGTFPFYCNLTREEGCKQMKGQLVVKRRK